MERALPTDFKNIYMSYITIIRFQKMDVRQFKNIYNKRKPPLKHSHDQETIRTVSNSVYLLRNFDITGKISKFCDCHFSITFEIMPIDGVQKYKKPCILHSKIKNI